jgi:hypothetical protein
MILPAHTQRDIRNAALSALHYIAFDQKCEVADIIALITPSQPGETSSAHAPAAQTDGEAQSSSLPTSPSVEPTPEQATECAPYRGSAEAPKETASDEGESNDSPSARRHASTDNRDGALAADLGTTQREDGASPARSSEQESQPARSRREKAAAPRDEAAAGKSAEALASAALRITDTQRLRDCVAEHPDWPASKIAEATGIRRNHIYGLAKSAKIKLPNASGYDAAQKAKVTEALKAPRSHRLTLADRIRDHLVKHPDASLKEVTDALGERMQSIGWAAQRAGIVLRKRTAEERSAGSAKGAQARLAQAAPPPPAANLVVQPAPERDVTDVLHVVRKPSASERFYIRDKNGSYLHQSLEASPTDDGPLMTTNRKWAWFDNAQRYAGACRKWPEIEAMRQEAPQP